MSELAILVCDRLYRLAKEQTKVAHDIEGWADKGVSVCSFAWSPTEALSVPLRHTSWHPWWSGSDEAAIVSALKAVLESPTVPKTFHNGAYEMFVWAWHYGITVRGVCDDTMIKHAVLFPELDKALDVCASIYTCEPYWKDMGDTNDDATLARYNALDSMLTFEINEAMEPLLSEGQATYYRTQVALLEPVLDMMIQGILYDNEERARLATELGNEVFALQGELDTAAGLKPPTFKEVAAAVASKLKLAQCTEWSHIVEHAKPSFLKPLELKRRKVGRPRGK